MEIISARTLKAGDKKQNTSDAYVVVKLDRSKKKSKVAQASLSPEWNETLIFGSKRPIRSRKGKKYDVKLEVWDRDKGILDGDDLLGSVYVNIDDTKQLAGGVALSTWYTIDEKGADANVNVGNVDNGKKKKRPAGDIQVRICAVDKTGSEWTGKAIAADDAKPLAPSPPSPPHLHHPRELFASGKLLRVEVLEAKDLKVGDKKSGTSDPYVILKLGSSKFKSSLQQSTIKPKWNESFTFGEKKMIKSKKKYEMKVEVWDRDKGILDADDLLGSVFIDINDATQLAAQVAKPVWYDLDERGIDASVNRGNCSSAALKRRRPAGSIKLRIVALDSDMSEWGDSHGDDMGDEALPWRKTTGAKKSVGTSKSMASTMKEAVLDNKLGVKVQVIAARNLKIGDKKTQTSDPYVVVRVQGKKKTTKVHQHTLNPEFKETFQFGTKSKLKTKGKNLVHIEVWDEDKGILDRDDKLASLALEWGSIEDMTLKGAQDVWYALYEKGSTGTLNVPDSVKPKKKKNAKMAGEILLRVVAINKDGSEWTGAPDSGDYEGGDEDIPVDGVDASAYSGPTIIRVPRINVTKAQILSKRARKLKLASRKHLSKLLHHV